VMREGLPEAESRGRADPIGVAAQFHQEGVLVWLIRDTTIIERGPAGAFLLERKLADTLLVASRAVLFPGCTARVRCRCSGLRVQRWSSCRVRTLLFGWRVVDSDIGCRSRRLSGPAE
jgi:hypothetical protein